MMSMTPVNASLPGGQPVTAIRRDRDVALLLLGLLAGGLLPLVRGLLP